MYCARALIPNWNLLKHAPRDLTTDVPSYGVIVILTGNNAIDGAFKIEVKYTSRLRMNPAEGKIS